MSPRPCECVDPEVTGCQCSFADSETVAFTGSGSSGDPVTAQLILDPDAANQAETTVNGLFIDTRLPACRLYRTTDLAVEANTLTVIEFAHELRDADNMHSNSVNISHISFAADGWVDLAAGAYYPPNDEGFRGLSIRLNGTLTVVTQEVPTVGGAAGTGLCCGTGYYVEAGDYAEVTTVQTSTTDPLNLEAHLDYSPFFYAAYRQNN